MQPVRATTYAATDDATDDVARATYVRYDADAVRTVDAIAETTGVTAAAAASAAVCATHDATRENP